MNAFKINGKTKICKFYYLNEIKILIVIDAKSTCRKVDASNKLTRFYGHEYQTM